MTENIKPTGAAWLERKKLKHVKKTYQKQKPLRWKKPWDPGNSQ